MEHGKIVFYLIRKTFNSIWPCLALQVMYKGQHQLCHSGHGLLCKCWPVVMQVLTEVNTLWPCLAVQAMSEHRIVFYYKKFNSISFPPSNIWTRSTDSKSHAKDSKSHASDTEPGVARYHSVGICGRHTIPMYLRVKMSHCWLATVRHTITMWMSEKPNMAKRDNKTEK